MPYFWMKNKNFLKVIYSQINLLVECKASEMPMFFPSSTRFSKLSGQIMTEFKNFLNYNKDRFSLPDIKIRYHVTKTK